MAVTGLCSRSDRVFDSEGTSVLTPNSRSAGPPPPARRRLGGVVAGGDQRDAELGREVRRVLLRLARDEAVEPERRRLRAPRAPAPPEMTPTRPHRAGAAAEHERRRAERARRAAPPAARRRAAPAACPWRPSRRPRSSPNGSRRCDAEHRQRAPRCCRAAGWASSGRWYAASVMSCRNSASSRRRSSMRMTGARAVPEQPVVHDEQLRARRGGALEHVERRGDGHRRPAPPPPPRHLQPVRPVVALRRDLELRVEPGQQGVAGLPDLRHVGSAAGGRRRRPAPPRPNAVDDLGAVAVSSSTSPFSRSARRAVEPAAATAMRACASCIGSSPWTGTRKRGRTSSISSATSSADAWPET